MNRTFLVLGAFACFMALNGFQCASSMMNSAELAMKGGDYEKARASAREEVALRPDNARAWMIIGRSEFHLGNYVEMKKAYDEAIEHRNSESGAITDQEVVGIELETAHAWSILYDSAQARRGRNEYARAIATLDSAEIVQPGNPMTTHMLGALYQANSDEDRAMKYFDQYIARTRADVTKGKEAGLALGYGQDRVRAALGQPTRPYNPQANQFGDFWADRSLIVYYQGKAPSLTVRGWDYVDAGQTPYLIAGLSADPYYTRAYSLREATSYDSALALLNLIDGFDPDRQTDIGNLLAQTYIDAGRVDEAEAELNRRIAQNPNDVSYRIRLSVLRFKQEDWAGAIDALQQALKLDIEEGSQDHQDILYNLGVYNKNWGVKLDKSGNTSPTAPSEEEIFAKYRAAIDYFQQLDRITGTFDPVLVADIGAIAARIGDDALLQSSIGRFEEQRGNAEFNASANYWRSLSRLYTYQGNVEKATEAMDRAKAIEG